jgi:Family of unknown function (DUF5335)
MSQEVRQEGSELPRGAWREFFQDLSSKYEGYSVTIDVVSREYGDQPEAQDMPLSYVDYDPMDDVLIIGVDSRDGSDAPVLRRMIHHPERVLADQVTEDVPWAIDIIDQDGSQTIVTLRRSGPPPPRK